VIGRLLGQFRILEQVGAGGMGIVYRARNERLQSEVAIKVLPPHALDDQSARRDFHRGAVAVSRINHPGIATVYDFQTIDGMDLLIMEYVPGESLDARIANGPLPEAQIVDLGIQLCEGLAEAHARDVIHRDLKPGNLRITPQGRLKVLDFGLAKWLPTLGSDSSATTTADSQTIVGTPAYLAPEVIRGEPADKRSDLYGVGLALYEMATGARPFARPTAGAAMAAALSDPPPPPRRTNPRISRELEAVILRCLEKDPARRFASATELADALRALRTPGTRTPAARRWLAPAGAALLLGAVVIAPRFIPLGSKTEIRSLAVLPLANLSNDVDQEYFADGMTEAVIGQLSNVVELRVISFTSVQRYKNARLPVPEIARQLGVDGVVEGTVARARNHLRITVNLIDARDDDRLWSGVYDGDTTDVLDLQSRVALAIVKEVQVQLSAVEQSRLQGRQDVAPGAVDAYQRGRYQWNKRSASGIRLAIDYFQSAIEMDSTYALAYSGLADAWAASGLYGYTTPTDARARALAAASRAVTLDPHLAEGHASLAHLLHNFDWRWSEAEGEYRRAIELKPNYALAHHFYAHLLAQQGRFDEARGMVATAQALDPQSLPVALAGASIEYFARDYDAALAACRRAATVDSTSSLLYRLQAGILDRLGREPEAFRSLARSFSLAGQNGLATALVGAYGAAGTNGAIDLLIGAVKRKRDSGAYEPAEHLAELEARRGRNDEAIRWLEIGFQEHDSELNRLGVDPIFDPLRSDPRFAELVRRIGLQPHARS